jgi:hypothetical protein
VRLADILTLHYVDAQNYLREEIKRSIVDKSVSRLFDSKRNSRIADIVTDHGLKVDSISNISETTEAEGPVKILQYYVEYGSTAGMSSIGIRALSCPESAGRDCQAIPLKNVMLGRTSSIVESLNAKGRTPWVLSGKSLISGDQVLYLDPRYGWYHSEIGSAAAIIENRILPLVNDYWDVLTKNDWQTVFEGSLRPATKVKRTNGYGFEVRTKNESSVGPASSSRQSRGNRS